MFFACSNAHRPLKKDDSSVATPPLWEDAEEPIVLTPGNACLRITSMSSAAAPKRWRAAWRIGAGRESEVFAVLDLDTGELLAAKRLRARFRGESSAAEATSLARYRREAELLAKLPPHPHVVAHLGVEEASRAVSRLSSALDSPSKLFLNYVCHHAAGRRGREPRVRIRRRCQVRAPSPPHDSHGALRWWHGRSALARSRRRLRGSVQYSEGLATPHRDNNCPNGRILTHNTRNQPSQETLREKMPLNRPPKVHPTTSCAHNTRTALACARDLLRPPPPRSRRARPRLTRCAALAPASRVAPAVPAEGALRSFARQLSLGLAFLHHHGVTHRDLKGSNVLLVHGGGYVGSGSANAAAAVATGSAPGAPLVVKLADFGCARDHGAGPVALVGDAAATDTAAAAGLETEPAARSARRDDNNGHHPLLSARGCAPPGTPLWCAPEALHAAAPSALGADAWQRADVWSLGCTLLELATGAPPWSAGAELVRPLRARVHLGLGSETPPLGGASGGAEIGRGNIDESTPSLRGRTEARTPPRTQRAVRATWSRVATGGCGAAADYNNEGDVGGGGDGDDATDGDHNARRHEADAGAACSEERERTGAMRVNARTGADEEPDDAAAALAAVAAARRLDPQARLNVFDDMLRSQTVGVKLVLLFRRRS